MTIFSDLPDELTSSLLQSWISVADLSRLDSAVCNTEDRPNYLAIIKSPTFVVRSSCFNEMERPHAFDEDEEREVMRRLRMAYMAWIMKRDISTSVIDVEVVLAHSAHNTGHYLTQHGKIVTEVVCSAPSELGEYDSVIGDLCGHCPHVRAFICNAWLGSAAKLHIATSWSELTKLTVQLYEGDNNFAMFGARCRVLTELTIICYNSDEYVGPGPEFFQLCAPTLRKITTTSKCFEEPVLHIIAARFPLLEELETTDTVTDAVLIALSTGCPCLHSLTLSSCPITDDGIVAVARNRALVTLSLTWCSAVTDAGLRAVAENCPQLEHLRLSHMPLVTDAAIVSLGKHCRNLRGVDLHVEDLTPAGLRTLAKGCSQLEDLQLWGCYDIGPAVEAVAEHCPKLRTLRVSHAQVPATALLALAKHCPCLEDVRLEGDDIRDTAVVALVSRCQQLYKLDVCQTAITPGGVHAIVRRCGRRLREMYVPLRVNPYSLDTENFGASPWYTMAGGQVVNVSHLRAWLLNPDPEDAR
jgi:hypothetical protein